MSAEGPKAVGEAAPNVVAIPQPIQPAPVQQKAQGGADTDSTGTASTLQTEDDHLNTDERRKAQWESRYPAKAQWAIRFDAVYVAAVLVVTLGAILLTWKGSAFQAIAGDCSSCSRTAFDRYAYFYLGGQLGGTLFGVKYLYNVVARGWWNIDRRLWRIFSPFLSGGLAFAVGALVDSGVLGLTTKAATGAGYLSFGFVTGYFADSALRKMKDIADTVFGSPESRSSHSSQAPKQ